MSSAPARPIIRGRREQPPLAGMIPRLPSGSPMRVFAESGARRQSMARAVSLQEDRGALAAAQAESGEAVADGSAVHVEEECEYQARPRGADGVAERDGAAVDVQDLRIDGAEIGALLEDGEVREDLRREG